MIANEKISLDLIKKWFAQLILLVKSSIHGFLTFRCCQPEDVAMWREVGSLEKMMGNIHSWDLEWGWFVSPSNLWSDRLCQVDLGPQTVVVWCRFHGWCVKLVPHVCFSGPDNLKVFEPGVISTQEDSILYSLLSKGFPGNLFDMTSFCLRCWWGFSRPLRDKKHKMWCILGT